MNKRQRTPPGDEHSHLLYTTICAKVALVYYNRKHGKQFELVEDEILESNPFAASSQIRSHCSFTAKEEGGSSLQRFFAEIRLRLFYDFPSGLTVTRCTALQGETKVGCKNCKSVTHPLFEHDEDEPTSPEWRLATENDKYYPMIKTPCAIPVDEPYRESHLGYSTMCAIYALGYYNREYFEEFELVEDETLDSNPFTVSSQIWIHCSFTAKKDSCSKQFYAEIRAETLCDIFSGLTITKCKVLEGETKVGCENCKSVIHPVVRKGQEAADESSSSENSENSDDVACYDVESHMKAHHKKTARIAEFALNHYNTKNRTKYEVPHNEIVDSYPFTDISGNWIHCSFHAVDSATEGSSIKHLFFAEIKYQYPLEPAVSSCKKLEEGEFARGCDRCYNVDHPVPKLGYLDIREIVQEDRDPESERKPDSLDHWDCFHY